MSNSHFVDDYAKHVAELQKASPEDRELAMAQAIGSATIEDFRRQGDQQVYVMRAAGLQNGDSLYDFACGSGRTASALARDNWTGSYLGVDVVPELIETLTQACPAGYHTKLHTDLTIAAEDATLDMICAWSIFTHLYAVESFIYLRDISRALKHEGRLVMSFLEFSQPTHWAVFNQNIERRETDVHAPLDSFIARCDLEEWCNRLGLRVTNYIDGMDESATPQGHIGQSVAIIEKS